MPRPAKLLGTETSELLINISIFSNPLFTAKYCQISLVEHQGTLYSILSLIEHQGTLYSIISLVEHQGTIDISSSYPIFVLTGVTKY